MASVAVPVGECVRDWSRSPPAAAVARSFAEIDEWPGPWQALRARAGLSVDDERAASGWTPGFERPHTTVIHEKGEPRLVVAGQVVQTTLVFKVGYRRVWSPRRRAIEIRPHAVAGEADEQAAEALVSSLLDSLRGGEADLVVLHQLAPSSAIYRAARRARPWWCRDGAPTANIRWILPFPEGRDQPLPLSAHTRRLDRYYTNRLGRKYGERLKIECTTRVEDLERLIRDVESVASKTYQRRLGVGFVDDERTRRRLRYFLEQGRYRAFVLSIDDRPRAFWLGLRTGALYESQETGFDPAFASDHVGKVLLAWKLESLRREGSVRELDFGFGDAAYKSHHATERREEETVFLFAPTSRGLASNLSRTGIGATNAALKKMAARLELFDAVRTRLRRRLVERGRTEES